MSQWSHNHPDLVGDPNFDPWMQHDGYARAMAEVKEASGDYCRGCGEFLAPTERRYCSDCEEHR